MVVNVFGRVGDCSEERFQLQVGDIVMVATDGLFDNLADSHILNELNSLHRKVPTSPITSFYSFSD